MNRERDTILHADFPQQLGYMSFHRTLFNAEGRPDFLVGAARDQQLQDFLLPIGKGDAAGGEIRAGAELTRSMNMEST